MQYETLLQNICKYRKWNIYSLMKMSVTIRVEFSSRIEWTILMFRCDYGIKIKRTSQRARMNAMSFPKYNKRSILIRNWRVRHNNAAGMTNTEPLSR